MGRNSSRERVRMDRVIVEPGSLPHELRKSVQSGLDLACVVADFINTGATRSDRRRQQYATKVSPDIFVAIIREDRSLTESRIKATSAYHQFGNNADRRVV